MSPASITKLTTKPSTSANYTGGNEAPTTPTGAFSRAPSAVVSSKSLIPSPVESTEEASSTATGGISTPITDEPASSDTVSIEDVQNGMPILSESPKPSDTITIQYRQSSVSASVKESSGSIPGSSGVEILPSDGNEESILDIIENDGIDGGDVEDGDTYEGESGSSSCLPADATVELSNGSRIRIDQTSVGDAVRIGPASYSQVYMFTHKTIRQKSPFVHLQGENWNVKMIARHYVYANYLLTPAGAVKAGDILHTENGSRSRATGISHNMRILCEQGVCTILKQSMETLS